MKKICANCSTLNEEEFSFCKNCGQSMEGAVFTANKADNHQAPPPQYFQQNYMPPVIYNKAPEKFEPKKYKTEDIFTVLGFVCSITGIFFFSLVLLPLGAVFSFLGFRGNNTKVLAVSGMVISIVGFLIKVGVILSDYYYVIPRWLGSGIFW